MGRDILEEYKKYKPMVVSIFNSLNGVVNTINNRAVLSDIIYKDWITNLFASIRYPISITVYLGGILEALDPVDDSLYHDGVCSLIALTLTHELLHADQALSIIEYSHNPAYNQIIEDAIERESYMWVTNNAQWFKQVHGFNINLSFISGSMVKRYYELDSTYKRIDGYHYYRQTISNILLRSRALPIEIEKLLNENDNIEVMFNSSPHITVKMNGVYIVENIQAFSQFANMFSSMFDEYTVSFSTGVKSYRDAMWVILDFTFSDGLVHPVRFKT